MLWLRDLGHDLRYAARTLAKSPGFALAAIGTLALGIGATSAVFSVAHALLVKPLPYAAQPERLVRLVATTPNPVDPSAPPRRVPIALSAGEARDLDDRAASIDGIGLWSPTVIGLAGVENAGHVAAARVSTATLALLDARPLLGRTFRAEDEDAGADVALIGETAWRRWFAADPAVLGRTITVQTVLGPRSSRPVQIVGVMPRWFAFPGADTAFWLLLPRAAGAQPVRAGLLARLAPKVTPAAALDEVGPIVRAMHDHADDVRYEMPREQDQLVAPVRPALAVLGAAVALLLLIACLNVANLLLARALSRSRELSIRAALGAGRGRLIRQGLTESALLGGLGGALGLAIAAAALMAFRRLATPLARIDLGSTGIGWGSGTFPRLGEVALDAPVLAVTAATAITAGLLVGLAAAWRAARADVFDAVRSTVATAAGGRTGRAVRRGLVVLQVAGAMTLLVGAVLLARSLQHLTATDPGYSSENVITFQVVLPAAEYPDARLLSFAESLVERLRGVPGVIAAAYANQLPMVALRDTAGGLWTTPDAERRGAPDGADARFVSHDYLAAMDIRVLAGRGFEPRDGAGQPRVLLVNEALARRQFPERDPIGLQVYVGRDTAPWTIAGVVRDVRQFGLDRSPEPQFFADLRQWTGGMPLFPTGAYYVVKTAGRPEDVIADARAIARGLDAGAALFNVARMDAVVASTLTRPRLYAAILGTFAVLGALLSAIGLYGVLTFLVQERTPELGIRMALGASRAAVLGLVLRQGGVLVAIGLLLGMAGAWFLERALGGLLYGVQPGEPGTMVAAAALFTAVALAAVLVPARRATIIEPLEALRRE